MFWLLVARVEKRDQIAIVAHGPDHPAGLARWIRCALDVCERHAWSVAAHLRPAEGGGEPWRTGASWGPPKTIAQIRDVLELRPDHVRSILLRVRGQGSALLFGLERGLHRFHGLAKIDPCHATVEPVASWIEFTDAVWASPLLASNRPTSPPKVTPVRTHPVRGELVLVDGAREVDVPATEYAARLEEIAVETILHRLAADPDRDVASLFTFTSDGPEPAG
jgi:hypothetical protein